MAFIQQKNNYFHGTNLVHASSWWQELNPTFRRVTICTPVSEYLPLVISGKYTKGIITPTKYLGRVLGQLLDGQSDDYTSASTVLCGRFPRWLQQKKSAQATGVSEETYYTSRVEETMAGGWAQRWWGNPFGRENRTWFYPLTCFKSLAPLITLRCTRPNTLSQPRTRHV